MSSYLKPQSPISFEDNYIYPLTTVDQVILENGNRLNAEIEKHVSIDIDGSNIGEAPTIDADTLGGHPVDFFLNTSQLPISVEQGGLGADTVEGARENLNVYSKDEVYSKNEANYGLYFANLSMESNVTLTAASTYYNIPLKTRYSYGDFFTLSSDGTVTFTKSLAVTVAAQLYFYSGFNADTPSLNVQTVLNGAILSRAQGKGMTASPYVTVSTAPITVQVNSGDTIVLQGSSSAASGTVQAYAFTSFLNIDVKGLIE